MKIELKHLAPYLPYGLTGLHFDDERSIKSVVTIELLLIPDELTVINSDYEYDINLIDFRPLLLPLSELTHEQLNQIIKHLFKNSRGIKPRLTDIECKKGFITFYDYTTSMRYTAVKPGGDKLPVLNMSNHFSDYDIFFELHIDMFNLIPAGLALNKLDYPITN